MIDGNFWRYSLLTSALFFASVSASRGEDGKGDPRPTRSEYYRRLQSPEGRGIENIPPRWREEDEEFGPGERTHPPERPSAPSRPTNPPKVSRFPEAKHEPSPRARELQPDPDIIQIPAPGEQNPRANPGRIAPAASSEPVEKPVSATKTKTTKPPPRSQKALTEKKTRTQTKTEPGTALSRPKNDAPVSRPVAPERKQPVREESVQPPPDKEEPSVPLERGAFAFSSPSYYRGIYINNAFFRTRQFPAFLKTAADHGMNTLVIDIQPVMPSAEVLKMIGDSGFYMVARVVCFPDGLATYPASPGQIDRILERAELGAKAGFAEIQLDYIRFADNLHVKGLTLDRRYSYLSTILQRFENRLRPYRVRVGADIFGRIAFNQNDIIGQKLEVFDPHLDTIYPMLYPSHFYGEPIRRRLPYRTILDGAKESSRRVKTSRIIPYIQAFTMRVGESGLSLDDYIRAQIDGARDSGAGGYIVWNARNDYTAFFRAVQKGRLVKPTVARNR